VTAVAWIRSARRLPVLLAAAPVAVGVGGLCAVQPLLGIGAAVGAGFALLALTDLALALALWIVVAFLAGLPGLEGAPTAGSLVLVVAWIGAIGTGRIGLRRIPGSLRIALVAAVAWMALSAVWAGDSALVGQDLRRWVIALVTFVVVVSVADRRRAVGLVVDAYVCGATLSVLAALAVGGGLESATGDAAQDARLQAGASDPNYLAATLTPALALALGRLAYERRPAVRALLIAAIPVCLYGLVATQSRGGLLALLAAAVAALVVCRGRRLPILGALAATVALLGLFLALSPAALERVTSGKDKGNGRDDLWHIAWRMSEEHPVTGVGLGNFIADASGYVREVGTVEYADLIVDDPKVVHNVYLQMLAETGGVGLALLAVLLALCLRASWRASRLAQRRGDAAGALLAQMLLVGQIGTLLASLFISNGDDRRLWILLALGPALAGLQARAMAAQPTTARARPAAADRVPVPPPPHPGPSAVPGAGGA
jgi:O-antigen ligase